MSRAVTARKYTKSRDAPAQLFFLLIETYCFFTVFVAVAVLVA